MYRGIDIILGIELQPTVGRVITLEKKYKKEAINQWKNGLVSGANSNSYIGSNRDMSTILISL